jgi:hypothetical protein
MIFFVSLAVLNCVAGWLGAGRSCWVSATC